MAVDFPFLLECWFGDYHSIGINRFCIGVGVTSIVTLQLELSESKFLIDKGREGDLLWDLWKTITERGNEKNE